MIVSLLCGDDYWLDDTIALMTSPNNKQQWSQLVSAMNRIFADKLT